MNNTVEKCKIIPNTYNCSTARLCLKYFDATIYWQIFPIDYFVKSAAVVCSYIVVILAFIVIIMHTIQYGILRRIVHQKFASVIRRNGNPACFVWTSRNQ